MDKCKLKTHNSKIDTPNVVLQSPRKMSTGGNLGALERPDGPLRSEPPAGGQGW